MNNLLKDRIIKALETHGALASRRLKQEVRDNSEVILGYNAAINDLLQDLRIVKVKIAGVIVYGIPNKSYTTHHENI